MWRFLSKNKPAVFPHLSSASLIFHNVPPLTPKILAPSGIIGLIISKLCRGTQHLIIDSIIMKLSCALIFSAGIFATSVSAFAPSYTTNNNLATRSTSSTTTCTTTTSLNQYAGATAAGGLVNIADEYAQRDVYSMEEWAMQYGAQKAPGIELYSEDGSDYQYVAQQGIQGGQTALYIPPDIVLNSASIQQEFGQSLTGAEQVVVGIDRGTQARLPLFRLMVKILAEYEKGQDSPFYPWLNSLPRQYYNGVSMTQACFDCLPPYAGWLASSERQNYSNFVAAIRQGGYLPLQQSTIQDGTVLKWAYNVALTRFHEVWQPERAKLIGPLADMVSLCVVQY